MKHLTRISYVTEKPTIQTHDELGIINQHCLLQALLIRVVLRYIIKCLFLHINLVKDYHHLLWNIYWSMFQTNRWNLVHYNDFHVWWEETWYFRPSKRARVVLTLLNDPIHHNRSKWILWDLLSWWGDSSHNQLKTKSNSLPQFSPATLEVFPCSPTLLCIMEHSAYFTPNLRHKVSQGQRTRHLNSSHHLRKSLERKVICWGKHSEDRVTFLLSWIPDVWQMTISFP